MQLKHYVAHKRPHIFTQRLLVLCRYITVVANLQAHYGMTDKCIPDIVPRAAFQKGWRVISVARKDSPTAYNHYWYAPAAFGERGATPSSQITEDWLTKMDPL